MTDYILLIARGCPTAQYPMNGIFEFGQAVALKKAGCKVVYAAIDLRSIRRVRRWGIEHYKKDGVEVYVINMPLGRVPHFILRLSGYIGLKKLFRMIKLEHGVPCIIHAHFLTMAEISLVLDKYVDVNTKFVMTEHIGVLDVPIWASRKAYYIYSRYNKVIAVSYNQKLLDNHAIEEHDNGLVIPNMLDPIFCKELAIHIDTSEMVFVFVGNLELIKSPLECIQAFEEAFGYCRFITEDNKKIKLKIIGDGPLVDSCRSLIKKLNVAGNIQLFGRLSRAEICNELSTSNCFVLPSKRETFGVAYIEAMACGLPVIATRCGGPESFVGDTNGLLIPVDDKMALVNAFQYMARNFRNYDRQEISRKTRERFAPQAVAKQLVALYKSLQAQE